MNCMEGGKSNEDLENKLKAVFQAQRLVLWKEHFKNLHGNSPEITDKLDIKRGEFTEENLM